MKCLSAPLLTALFASLVAFASPARADWVYTTNPSPPGLTVTNGSGATASSASVQLTPFSNATGSSTIPVIAYVTSSGSTPVTFDSGDPNTHYQLTLNIMDNSTHASNTWTFNGAITGTLGTTGLTNSLTPVGSSTFSLGKDVFTVTIPDQALTGPGQQNIIANVTVNGGGGGGTVSSTPEPASLVLGGLGFSFFGAGCWFKRRRDVTPVA